MKLDSTWQKQATGEQMWLDKERSQARGELTSQRVQRCPMIIWCYSNHSLAPTVQRGSFVVPVEERWFNKHPYLGCCVGWCAVPPVCCTSQGVSISPPSMLPVLNPIEKFSLRGGGRFTTTGPDVLTGCHEYRGWRQQQRGRTRTRTVWVITLYML